jgi:phosphate transport system substrate-binding protein
MNTFVPSRGRARSRVLAVAALAALGLVAGACSSSKTTSTTTVPSGVTTTTVHLASATLNGDGSSFQAAFDQEAAQEFHSLYSGVTVNYPGNGSTTGVTDLQKTLVNFAGTDLPITDISGITIDPTTVLYFPTVVAPITVSYNLTGVSQTLDFSGTTLAKIFAGKITTWNDPAIAKDNPGVTLPSTKITPVHRSDGSGTTRNFTLYLSKVDPTDWTAPPSTTFPNNLGLAGAKNSGVAASVQSTSGAIGYVDFATATAGGLKYGEVINYAGTPVAATLAGASAAAAATTVNADLTYDPTDAQAPTAYPITSPTWIVVYKTQTNAATGAALKAFLSFILTTGQTKVASATGYAALQGSILSKAQAQLSALVIP